MRCEAIFLRFFPTIAVSRCCLSQCLISLLICVRYMCSYSFIVVAVYFIFRVLLWSSQKQTESICECLCKRDKERFEKHEVTQHQFEWGSERARCLYLGYFGKNEIIPYQLELHFFHLFFCLNIKQMSALIMMCLCEFCSAQNSREILMHKKGVNVWDIYSFSS